MVLNCSMRLLQGGDGCDRSWVADGDIRIGPSRIRQNAIGLNLPGNGLEIETAPNGWRSCLGLPPSLVFDNEVALWGFHRSSVSHRLQQRSDHCPVDGVIANMKPCLADPQPLA